MKRKYSGLRLEDALQLIPVDEFVPWQLSVPLRPPSDFLKENLRRLEAFDLQMSELGKTLLIDALFAEIVPNYPKLKDGSGGLCDHAEARVHGDPTALRGGGETGRFRAGPGAVRC
jgi:hypothetical protein